MSALETYIARLPAELHELVHALDVLIRKAAGSLEPSVKWGNLTYHHATNVCSIVAHARDVNLLVWEAATPHDPAGRLAGTGKAMRHIRLHPEQPFDPVAITAIVHAAATVLRAPDDSSTPTS